MLDRLRARFSKPIDRAAGVSPPAPEPELPAEVEPEPEQDGFQHAPDAMPEDVPPGKKIGFDGHELPERGPQSGSFPTGGYSG